MTEPARRRGRVLWAFVLVLDVPVVAAVLVGLLAVVASPRPYWWMQLIAIGLPYATWALAAFGVVWALGKRWGGLAFHAVLVLLVLLRAGVLDRFSVLEEAEGDLVITTFNVPRVGPSREALGDSVVAFVRESGPDLLLFQDAWVWGQNELRRARPTAQDIQVVAVLDALPYDLDVPPRLAGHPGWRDNKTCVPVLVRRLSGVVFMAPEADVMGSVRDGLVSLALRTHVRWHGREAVLYNVHLRSFGEAKPWADEAFHLFGPSTWIPYLRKYKTVFAQRGDEVDEIARRIEGESLPVIVAGDFNSTADNWAYRRLRTAGAPRADAFRKAGGWHWGRTYHAERPFVRIDFVLADAAFEVTSARTSAVEFSDHRPVRVTLRWREPSSAAGS